MLTLNPRRWYGWQQLSTGGISPPWRASPIFIEAVIPLKTGSNLIELELVMLLRPYEPRRERLRLRVVTRTSEALIALCEPSDEQYGGLLIAISEIDRGWIDQHCPWLRTTHSMLGLHDNGDGTMTFTHNGEGASAQDYLNHAFGETPMTIIGGAAAAKANWPTSRTAPRLTSTVPIGKTMTGLNAYLLLQGTIPQAQEDKWFIYHEADRVIFQRSWTGIKIWTASVVVRTDSVAVTSLTVNRDRRQYAYGTPNDEIARFEACITTVLLGRPIGARPDASESPRKIAAAWRSFKTATTRTSTASRVMSC